MSTETTTETRSRVGSYKILSTLGRGGMGVVYLAEHTDSKERVAIKTLFGAMSSHVRGLRQEIEALREHRHPYVVRVVDDGVSDGIPWYAMEVLTGRPLDAVLAERDLLALAAHRKDERETTVYRSTAYADGLVAVDPVAETVISEQANAAPESRQSFLSAMAETGDLGGVSETTETVQPAVQATGGDAPAVFQWAEVRVVLRWIAHVAQALAYLHERGVVHRDLKPSNVFVTQKGRAVLMDFGLATKQDQRVSGRGVETAGFAAGTALYMSPEVIQGRRYDARCDLYSLGCMLYEAVTGSPPFVANAMGRIIHAHVFLTPESLHERLTGVPEPLNDLVMGLLEKEPANRTPYAQLVLRELAALGVQDAEVQWDRVPQIYRSSLMGRERLTAALTQGLQSCRSAHRSGETPVRLVFLEGASGVGKSRLVMETGRVANRLGYRILSGGCQTLGGGRPGGPLHPWLAVLRKIVDEAREKGHHARDIFGAHARALAPYVPFLDETPGLQDLLPAAEIDLAAARHRLFEVLAHALRTYALKSPLLVVIDDMQWVDELTLGLLGHLHDRLEHGCIFMMTARSEESRAGLSILHELSGAEVHRVERLPRAAMVQMIDEMLGGMHDAEAVWELVGANAAGNPYFLEESVRHLVASSMLTFSGSSSWQLDADASAESVAYPETLAELVAARVKRLSGDAAKIVRMASVLGRTFTAELLALALEQPVSELVLGELIRRDVVEWHGPEELRFTHDKLVELIYADVAARDDERLHLHGCAARAYEVTRERGESVDLGRLAWHLEESGRTEDARATYFDACRQAADGSAHAESEAHLVHGLGLTTVDDAMSLSAKVKFATKVLQVQGRMEEAERCLDEVLETSSPEHFGHVHAQGLIALGVVYLRTGRMSKAGIEKRSPTTMQRFRSRARWETDERRALFLATLGVFIRIKAVMGKRFPTSALVSRSPARSDAGDWRACGLATLALFIRMKAVMGKRSATTTRRSRSPARSDTGEVGAFGLA
jgi:eukaryotic-like serine/threonine-protein kinase